MVIFDCFDIFVSIGTKNFVTLILFGFFFLMLWLFHFYFFLFRTLNVPPFWLMVHCNINIHFYLLYSSSSSASISNSYRDFYGVPFFFSQIFFFVLFIHKYEYPINFIDHHFITLHWQVLYLSEFLMLSLKFFLQSLASTQITESFKTKIDETLQNLKVKKGQKCLINCIWAPVQAFYDKWIFFDKLSRPVDFTLNLSLAILFLSFSKCDNLY